MAFNKANEYRKFKREQEKTRKLMEKEGADPETIDKVLSLFADTFWSDMRYARMISDRPIEEYESAEIVPESLVDLSEISLENVDKYWWMDEIEDERLYESLKMLDDEEMELIDLYAFQEYSQKEIAGIKKCTQSAVSKSIDRIRAKLDVSTTKYMKHPDKKCWCRCSFIPNCLFSREADGKTAVKTRRCFLFSEADNDVLNGVFIWESSSAVKGNISFSISSNPLPAELMTN